MVKFTPESVDYSLYLVTGRELLPAGKDYYESLEESLKGGVTVVQVREKTIDTGEFVEIARRTKEITDKYGVPLFINDRVDVCLAVGAAGLHVGQTDMPVDLARSLLPKDIIIGISVSSTKEAQAAVDSGLVDYVGIGAVWWTGSKDLKGKLCLGVDGVGEVLDVLAEGQKVSAKEVKSVAIGGIHLPNLPQLLHGSPSPKHLKGLDGVAVISDIVGSPEPENAARKLRAVLDSYHRARKDQAGLHAVFGFNLTGNSGYSKRNEKELLEAAAGLIAVVRESTPLAHQITNIVVANDSANATLAMGGSPIMASAEQEVGDLSKVISGLLINFGTIKDRAGMLVAGKAANVNKKPIVFDPVAVGATAFRRQTSKGK
ncbi:hypothetical protein QFC24_003708 [Naganishia onofrii]|uniref:Uncharacterized protein n=1 Tax=Naganishia onofrii TaxID=1851511 RepID=A0ACC2XJE5_9TREE|nr:hypothetical protein QFC24_003708 [Naganishia onofrii]